MDVDWEQNSNEFNDETLCCGYPLCRFVVSQFCRLPVTFLSWDRSIFAAVGLNSNKLCLERNRILRPNLVRAYGLMTLSSFSSNLVDLL